MHDIQRWWAFVWERPMWKAILYLALVALRALFVGGGMMMLLVDMAPLPRAVIGAIVGVGMSVFTGIAALRARMGEDW